MNKFSTKKQQRSGSSERLYQDFKHNRQKHKKNNHSGRIFTFQDPEVIQVEVYYEPKDTKITAVTSQVIDIYVDSNDSDNFGNYPEGCKKLVTGRGEVKLLPYIENKLSSETRTWKNRVLGFMGKVTSYIAENYKDIIANLSLLIVFITSIHLYLTSESFNYLLNWGIVLRRLLSRFCINA